MNREVLPLTEDPAPVRSFRTVVLWSTGVVATGVIALAIQFYVFAPPTDADEQTALDIRVWNFVRLSVFIALGLFLVIFSLSRRGMIFWASVARHLRKITRVICGLRLRIPYTSAKSRTADAALRGIAEHRKYDEGFAARSTEIAAEREDVRRKPPSFKVERTDGWHQNEFMLTNWGWAVGNVWLTAPEDEFVFDQTPPVWPGEFGTDSPGGGIGKAFYGLPTDKGYADGVNFKIVWSWQNLDRDETLLHAKPGSLIRTTQTGH